MAGYYDQLFNNNVEQLKLFQSYYGVQAPSRKDPNDSLVSTLGSWAHRIRRMYRSGSLTGDRIDLLKRSNFAFELEAKQLSMSFGYKLEWDRVINSIVTTGSVDSKDTDLLSILIRASESDLLIDEHKEKLADVNLLGVASACLAC